MRYLRKYHRDLWDRLLELEGTPRLIGDKWNTLTGITIRSKEEQFELEDEQMTFLDEP